MLLLKDLLKKEIPLKEVAEQIRYNMEHPLRLQLLHYMFNIAKADGHVHMSEVNIIRQISNYMGISERDYLSIEAMFHKDIHHAYAILEIAESASGIGVMRIDGAAEIIISPPFQRLMGQAPFLKQAGYLFQQFPGEIVAGRLCHAHPALTLDRYAAWVPARDREAAEVLGCLGSRPPDTDSAHASSWLWSDIAPQHGSARWFPSR